MEREKKRSSDNYSIFGLRLQSNQSIPFLKNSEIVGTGTKPDIQVCLDRMPLRAYGIREMFPQLLHVSDFRDEKGDPGLKIWKLNNSYYRFCYSDGTEFLIDREGTRVWATWPNEATLEDTLIYLIGPVLGFLLCLRGATCLHASAVAIKDHAIAFFGPAEAGKSTIAAAFAIQGYPALTDDIVALRHENGGLLVQPGYPYISLWQNSAEILYGKSGSLPRLTPASGKNSAWDKRYLDLTQKGYHFHKHPLPLGAIYILGEFNKDSSAPCIEGVSPSEGFIKLLSNKYVKYFFDKEAEVQEFELLGQLANSIPLRKITPHSYQDDLPKLCEMINTDFEELISSTMTK